MKKNLALILLLFAFLLGCSSTESSPDNNNNTNEQAPEQEEQDKTISIGEPALLTQPETSVTEELKIEIIVHGIDYVSEQLDYEGDQEKNYLIIDYEIKNVSDHKFPSHFYPLIHAQNSKGHITQVYMDSSRLHSHTFNPVTLAPGGHLRGVIATSFDKDIQLESVVLNGNEYSSMYPHLYNTSR